MYKKAILFLTLGVAVFYSAAMIKFVLTPKAAVIPPVAIVDPPPIEQPPLIPINPEVDPNGNNVKPRIDVVFTIDSTGSMGDEIDVVKTNIKNIISEISQGQPAPDVRYGIVTFRDRGDQYVTKSWQFTRDVQSISSALNSIVADGGGDKPEAVAEGLHVTLHNMKWDEQAKSKIVFLIGDAGPHEYANSYKWQDEAAFAAKNNIIINTIAGSGIEDQEARVFNEIANPTNGQFAHLTYKQEVAKADGSKAVIIEEAGKTYELSKAAGDKDWSHGADELIARNEAKEISGSSYSGYSSSYATEGDVMGGVAGGSIAEVSAAEAKRSDMPAPPMEDDMEMDRAEPAKIKSSSLAKDKNIAMDERAARRDAKPMSAPMPSAMGLSAPARSAEMAGPALTAKTNNLSAVLTSSIKKEASRQGITYGSAISPAFEFKGSNSGVKAYQQVLIDNKAQLQALAGKAGIDINRIDFNTQMVVAIFLGESASDASITITNVSLSGSDLMVTAKREMGKGGSKSATPFHLVVIPRQNGSTKLDAKNFFAKFSVN